MSSLHTLSRSPREGLLATCATLLRPGDGVIFIEDGVYHAVQPASIPKLVPDVQLYCLRQDLLARGVSERLANRIEPVSYAGFVALCCEFDKVISWF